MDASKSAAAVAFLVALNLSFGYLRVQATTSNCSVTQMVTPRLITADDEALPIFCFDGNVPVAVPVWTIGSDICNASGFVPYERCPDGTFSCPVDSSDFLQRGPTFVCCQAECFEFKIDPIVNRITVPPVIQAGKEVTVYATFAAKPLPPDVPPLIVKIIQANEQNGTEIDTSALVVPSPTNGTEYIILYTFVVEVEEVTMATSRLELPEDWRSVGDISSEPIGVVFPAIHTTDEAPTTGGTPTTTDPATATSISPSTTATNLATTSTATVLHTTENITPTTPVTAAGSVTAGLSPGSTCIAAGHLAAAIVISIAVPVIIFIAIVCVFCFLYKKRRDTEKSYSDKDKTKISEEKSHLQTNGFVRNNALRASLSLQVHPHTVVTQQSITPTSLFGETPADEETSLLPSSSRLHAAAAASSPAPVTGATNLGYSPRDSTSSSPRAIGPMLDRISSRESNSPTTPYTSSKTMQPLLERTSSDEPSAAAAASTNKITEPLGTGLGHTSGAESSFTGAGVCDQHIAAMDRQEELKDHVYEEVHKHCKFQHLPPALRPLPATPGPESRQQNTLPAARICSCDQCSGLDRGRYVVHNIHATCPSRKQLLLSGENSSQCSAPPIADMYPPGSSSTDDLYSPNLIHEGRNMILPPQSDAVSSEQTSFV